MKKLFFLALIITFFIFSGNAAQAVTTDRPVVDKMKNSSAGAMREEKMTDKQERTTDNLQTRAEKEINRRIASLNKLLTRIVEFKKLTTAQKTALSSNVQEQIDELNDLLEKIKADTDVDTLKTDVKSIVSSYRIYALYMPQIQIIGAAERLLNAAEQLTTHATSLETKITEAKTAGSDTTELEALLADMQAKIADAQTQAQGAIDAVLPLTPEGFPDNKATLQSARQMVVSALKDLNLARQDSRKIIVGLIKLNKDASPTVEPTTSL